MPTPLLATSSTLSTSTTVWSFISTYVLKFFKFSASRHAPSRLHLQPLPLSWGRVPENVKPTTGAKYMSAPCRRQETSTAIWRWPGEDSGNENMNRTVTPTFWMNWQDALSKLQAGSWSHSHENGFSNPVTVRGLSSRRKQTGNTTEVYDSTTAPSGRNPHVVVEPYTLAEVPVS